MQKVVLEARDTRRSSALDFTYVTAHILEIWRPSRSFDARARRSGGVHTNSRASYSCEHYRRDTPPLRRKRDSRERKRSCRSEKGSTEPSPSENRVQERHPGGSALCARDTPWRSRRNRKSPNTAKRGTAESYVSSTTPFKVESVLDSSGPRTFHFYCTEEAAQFTFTTQTSDLVRSGPCSANRVVSFTLPASAYRDGKLVLNIDSSIAGTPVEVLTERKNQ